MKKVNEHFKAVRDIEYLQVHCFGYNLEEKFEDKRKTTIERYELANSAKVGDIIKCPYCKRKHIKKSYQHKFYKRKVFL